MKLAIFAHGQSEKIALATIIDYINTKRNNKITYSIITPPIDKEQALQINHFKPGKKVFIEAVERFKESIEDENVAPVVIFYIDINEREQDKEIELMYIENKEFANYLTNIFNFPISECFTYYNEIGIETTFCIPKGAKKHTRDFTRYFEENIVDIISGKLIKDSNIMEFIDYIIGIKDNE